jgi:hypothetical protein
MSWTTNALRKYLTGGRQETFDQCLSRLRHGDGGPQISAAERIEQLEDDLARAVLLVHTLVEACVKNGVFTRREIVAVAQEIDLFDGVADGRLDPAAVRGRVTRPEAPAPRG